jgi:hypothetical protein
MNNFYTLDRNYPPLNTAKPHDIFTHLRKNYSSDTLSDKLVGTKKRRAVAQPTETIINIISGMGFAIVLALVTNWPGGIRKTNQPKEGIMKNLDFVKKEIREEINQVLADPATSNFEKEIIRQGLSMDTLDAYYASRHASQLLKKVMDDLLNYAIAS